MLGPIESLQSARDQRDSHLSMMPLLVELGGS